MQLYAGLDLHSTNTYIGILDQEFNRVFKKRVANNLDLILQKLKPFGILGSQYASHCGQLPLV